MPFIGSNKKAALWAAESADGFNWRLWRLHFAFYEVLITVSFIVRAAISGNADGWGLLLPPLLYSPLAAVAAWYAMRLKPRLESDPIAKPRVWKSVCAGLAISLSALAFGVLAR